MSGRRGWIVPALLLIAPAPALANVITDWDEKAVALVQPGTVFPPPTALRTTAMLHLAMHVAANPDTSQEAAAASAAGAVLMKLVPNAAPDIQTAVTSYLEKLPDSEAKSAGVKLGQEVAAGILEMRANDGASAADAYRPKTRPGVYIPTAITIGWAISRVTPFAMTSPVQFRPKPPPSLKSAEWARDYNEIKELGEKNSTKRTARQTEDARFWISVNPGMSHQLVRQIVVAKNMDTVDSAHFMALAAVAEADAGHCAF